MKQETSEMQFEEYALKLNARAFPSWSKAKAQPQRRFSASSSTKTILVGERIWTDVEQQDYSPTDYSVSKKLINLLRHGSLLEDGAIEFWRWKDYLQNHHHCSDEEKRKILQYCTDSSGDILYLRALQGHSGRSLIDPSSQDSVLIPNVFFKYTYHVGCAINLQSIINSGLISGGQNFEQETDGILSACESYGQRTQRSWDNRPESTASCTVHADSVEGTSEHFFFWVDIKLAQKNGFRSFSTSRRLPTNVSKP